MAEPVKDPGLLDKAKEVVDETLPTRSKNADKKAAKAAEKAQKKAAYAKADAQKAADAQAKQSKSTPVQSTETVRDTDAIFREGWLADVKNLRSEKDVYTRFPPEPNGYLHIGHSKAIAINFGFARYHGGRCYLRFDDTNPEAEEEKFFTAILDIITWLGFTPYKITYTSDNFDQLYELAEKLILKDGAYMCYCTDEQIKDQRGGPDDKNKHARYPCAHRSQPPEQSLSEFRAMRAGKYKPREAFLRFKTDDYVNGNPQMWDLAAYRILEQSHHRTGTKWRIYPTYDFAHCICDSIEGITHSLCTTEFINSRESYEWLNHALDIYEPSQREYGRLNLTGTIMSKRKIARLVRDGKVLDWDDPRLYTLVALRRRGIPPGAILSFVGELGVTTAKTNIQIARFEQSVRKYLELSVPRLMLVLDPIKVVITNLPNTHLELISNDFGPKGIDMGSHTIPFTNTIYIERDDFHENPSKDYFRLGPKLSVGLLKVPYPITCTSFNKDPATNLITEVFATYDTPTDESPFKKPKAYIHWVAESKEHNSPIKAEARVFTQLFKSDNPEAAEPDFMADIADKSLTIFPGAMLETGFTEIRTRAPWPAEAGEAVKTSSPIQDKVVNGDAHRTSTQNGGAKGETGLIASSATVKAPGPESVRFQAMRQAYFCVDRESTSDKIVLNRIVGLKEDSGKSM